MRDISIICIWYKPDEITIKRWLDAASQICPIIIVDNSPYTNKLYGEYADLERKGYISYTALGDNKGIAFAQNIGIDVAIAKGIEYVIFFDQDSIPSKELVFGLYNDYLELKNNVNNLAAIGPKILNKDSGHLYKEIHSDERRFVEISTLISSGTLVNTKIFDAVGKMNSTLFIDLVDHEWCWRAKAKGFVLYRSNRRNLPHKVGSYDFSFLGIKFIISSPERYYYKYRNFVWLLKDCNSPFKWKVKNLFRKIIEFILIPCIVKDKYKTFNSICKGLIDGLKIRYEKY